MHSLSLFTILVAIISTPSAFCQTDEQSQEQTDASSEQVQSSKKENSKYKDCASVEQLSPIRTRCQTSKGYVFKRVKNGWKDIKGITWYDAIVQDSNPFTPHDFCKSMRKRLPTGWPKSLNGKSYTTYGNDDAEYSAYTAVEDEYRSGGYRVKRIKGEKGMIQITLPMHNSELVTAVDHGISEVFKDMKSRFFWSSTFSEDPSIGSYLLGDDGNYIGSQRDFGWGYSEEHDSKFFARCVSR